MTCNTITVMLPLVGAFFSGLQTFGIVGGLLLLRGATVTLGIPTMAASLSWFLQTRSKYNFLSFLVHVLVPASCMLFFITQTSGYAWCYSLYWFIPMIAYFLQPKKNFYALFTKALATTFIAHALGSILFLFFVPMTTQQWLALIPLVAVERFVFAAGLVCGHYGITWSVVSCKNLIFQGVACVQKLHSSRKTI